ncbi:DNA repair RAD52-like protein 1, mitochondrial isoform X2 [Tripterygium wilfordii]|uniref:DNA repair RAD52-like protein 1, mitochondrial isoform X2 n=1 Tax=Tripterygium wilfordii TaxID=458696 RepID=UPI0018F86369|nr:DNA repair RAD52-like protein 1, mitochondrial isoform X2 [Tripterygium wilfordii]
MAAAMSSLTRSLSSSSSFQKMPSQASLPLFQLQSYLCCFYSSKPSSSSSSSRVKTEKADTGELLNDIEDAVPTSGISRPLSEVLKQLNKKVPDSLVRLRHDGGFTVKYVPWHIVNRIMNLHAPEWSGEVRSITYSADGKSVSVVYRVTIYGTDAEIYRESTGTALMDEVGYGDPVQKAEAMAFRRACARFGLGLHLYHEDML